MRIAANVVVVLSLALACGPVPRGPLGGELRPLPATGSEGIEGDELYELRAERVRVPAEREPVLLERGYDPVPDGVVLFRFEPRG